MALYASLWKGFFCLVALLKTKPRPTGCKCQNLHATFYTDKTLVVPFEKQQDRSSDLELEICIPTKTSRVEQLGFWARRKEEKEGPLTWRSICESGL